MIGDRFVKVEIERGTTIAAGHKGAKQRGQGGIFGIAALHGLFEDQQAAIAIDHFNFYRFRIALIHVLEGECCVDRQAFNAIELKQVAVFRNISSQ